MKRRLIAVLGGGTLGLVMAGLVVPLAVVFPRGAWPGERTLWATAVAVVVAGAGTGWLLSGRKKNGAS